MALGSEDQPFRTLAAVYAALGIVRRDEFERAYAARSGVTVDQLHAWGRWAEPCDCGEDGCEGWAMGRQQEDAIWEDQFRMGEEERPVPFPGSSVWKSCGDVEVWAGGEA